ncbi:cytochrome P450 family protein [Nocardia takedensis]|uniref:cytochrome P450 family protein n=1 Tax=Nocardia takedensis TaxID=259390 RepID=UPI0003171548|nr:cytochrome P450 [Nocardia takedensis]
MKQLPQDFFRAPYGHYARWRAEGPVHPVEFSTGARAWVVVGYDAARQVLRDPTVRKDPGSEAGAMVRGGSGGGSGLTAVNPRLLRHLLNSDGAHHTRMRRAVSPVYAPGRVDALIPRVTAIAESLLDRLAAAARENGHADLMTEFAFPLPITVICEMLGVPVADRHRFRYWSMIVSDATLSDPEEMRVTTDAIVDYFDALLAERRAHGRADGTDLLSTLLHAPGDGERLTDDEILATAFLVLIAGHETTVNLLGNSVLTLLSEPGRYREVAEHPDRVPGLVEEMLRYDGPVNMSTMRYTTAPIVVGDTVVPAGEMILVALGSTNRDERRFPAASRFDPARDQTGHMAFGHGVHFCLGAGLARMESRIALTALLRRFPDLRLAVDPADLRWQESLLFRGVRELPVDPSPAAARA